MKSISKKRRENRQLDLDEAFGKSFSDPRLRHSGNGGVVRVDEATTRSMALNSYDNEMDDFMKEVSAADALARENNRKQYGADIRYHYCY